MTTNTAKIGEDLIRAVTRNLVGRLEAVALLFQSVTLASSAATDKDAFAPGGSTLFYGLAIAHLVLGLTVFKIGGPFHHGGLWAAAWLGMAFLMPLVIAHLAGPINYASNPVCTQMCSYGGPAMIVFAFYPWVIARWRLPIDLIVLIALLTEPLLIMLVMKPNPQPANFVSVTLSGTAILLGFILGKALGYMCRVAARTQQDIERRKDDELFNFLHSHVRGCLHAIRAEHGAAAVGIRQLVELDEAITLRRKEIQYAQGDIPLASIVHEHVRRFTPAQSTRIRSVPNIGALTVRAEAAHLFDRALGDLLANAITHANASDIDIGFTTEDGAATLDVTDNGSGISPDVLDDASTSLHRLRHDARLLDGNLTVVATNPGSRVSLSIPLQPRKRRSPS